MPRRTAQCQDISGGQGGAGRVLGVAFPGPLPPSTQLGNFIPQSLLPESWALCSDRRGDLVDEVKRESKEKRDIRPSETTGFGSVSARCGHIFPLNNGRKSLPFSKKKIIFALKKLPLRLQCVTRSIGGSPGAAKQSHQPQETWWEGRPWPGNPFSCQTQFFPSQLHFLWSLRPRLTLLREEPTSGRRHCQEVRVLRRKVIRH